MALLYIVTPLELDWDVCLCKTV
ncbi:hypothetical protein MTR67_018366, partial [Solanum verrucosum]